MQHPFMHGNIMLQQRTACRIFRRAAVNKTATAGAPEAACVGGPHAGRMDQAAAILHAVGGAFQQGRLLPS